LAQDTFIEGIKDLKTASLIFVIGTILGIIAGAAASAVMASGNLSALIGIYVIGGVGAVISIVATIKLIAAAGKLDSARPGEYRIAKLLIMILILAFILSIVSGFWSASVVAQALGRGEPTLSLLAQLSTPATIGLIAAAVTLIGYIGVLLMSIKLKDETGDTLFLVAGILIVIVILSFIGWILMLIATNNALKRGIAPVPMAAGGVGELPPPPPPA